MGAPRSFQNHLLNDEEILDFFVSQNWTWIATTRRLVKYRKTDSGHEELRDVSYSEISSISLTHHGKDTNYLLLAIGIGVLGLLLTQVHGGYILLSITAAIPLIKWINSEKSVFQFRGTGPVRDSPEEWQIDRSSVETEQKLNEFIKAVRSQIDRGSGG
jgi:hypothetical protein